MRPIPIDNLRPATRLRRAASFCGAAFAGPPSPLSPCRRPSFVAAAPGRPRRQPPDEQRIRPRHRRRRTLVVDNEIVRAAVRVASCIRRVVSTSGVLNLNVRQPPGSLRGERDLQRHVARRDDQHAARLGIVQRGIARCRPAPAHRASRAYPTRISSCAVSLPAGASASGNTTPLDSPAGTSTSLASRKLPSSCSLNHGLLRLVREIRHLHERLPLFRLGFAPPRG